jgi:hypothetical protein
MRAALQVREDGLFELRSKPGVELERSTAEFGSWAQR